MWQIVRYEAQGKENSGRLNKTWSQTNGNIYVGVLTETNNNSFNASKGAESVSKSVSAYLIDNFEDFFLTDNDGALKISLLAMIRHALGVLADDTGCPLSELDCSIHAVALSGDRYIILSLGKGMAVLEKEEKLIALNPAKEVVDVSVLSPQAPIVLNILRGNLSETEGFILLSNTLKDAFYNKDDEVFSDKLSEIIEAVEKFTPKTAHSKIHETISDSVEDEMLDNTSLLMIRKSSSTKGSKTLPLPGLKLEK